MALIEIPYAPRPLQWSLHQSLKRFSVLVCHRRFGKTVFSINHLLRAATQVSQRAPRFGYIAPLYRQAKQVAWDYLKYYTAPVPGRKVNEGELRVDLPGDVRMQLYGADNPDSLRGLYFDGVILDEYAQMSPRLWSEVVRPALVDRKGFAIFIGTPMGRNQFWEIYDQAEGQTDWFRIIHRASETGVVSSLELEAGRRTMTPEQYEQEFECSWQAAITGAFYGREVAAAEDSGRVTNTPYDPSFPVDTWWDLGVSDATAIWFTQRIGPRIHVIDYYENSGVGLPHYAEILQERGYVYGGHVAPPDIEVREFSSGQSRRDTAMQLGIFFTVAPRLRLQDGIDAVRRTLPKCYFDKEKCARGLEALRQYRTEYDDKRKAFKASPLHDWTSHASDAFRYGCITGSTLQAYSDWDETLPLNVGVL